MSIKNYLEASINSGLTLLKESFSELMEGSADQGKNFPQDSLPENKDRYVDAPDVPGALLLTLIGCGPTENKDSSDSTPFDRDVDGDGFKSDVDCNDENATINPEAEEVCDGVDNNCDDEIDANAADADLYPDSDGDGFGDRDSAALCSGVDNKSDCDDTDESINPNSEEICDGYDNDCDGIIDVDAIDQSTWYVDSDNDGYGSAISVQITCGQPEGYVSNVDDCDDTASITYPGADEICDENDNDCNGYIDNASIDAFTWYQDRDSDGFGNAEVSAVTCTQPVGYVSDGADCDDSNDDIYPTATESCNEIDDDCDGNIDEGIGAVWYFDGDNDGYGVDSETVSSCTQPAGYAALSGDCNDTLISYNPSSAETDCSDPNDYNCDGAVPLYVDADGDGAAACEDCDDLNFEVNQDVTEVCNGIDDDCDGDADSTAVDAPIWYVDNDADGYGVDTNFLLSCDQPVGYVSSSGDCNDSDPAYNPAALESDPSDPNDYNCDGVVPTGSVDGDGDGFAIAEDCDDLNPSVNSDASEICDSIDNNCDGLTDDSQSIGAGSWYADADGDGFGDVDESVTSCAQPEGYVVDATDCDDINSSINLAASEICNGLDDDCDGVIDNASNAIWYADADDDGFGDAENVLSASCSEQPEGYVSDSSDCDDTNLAIYPTAAEECDDVDQNCNGLIDDNAIDAPLWNIDSDGDGFGNSATTLASCNQPEGYTSDSNDCNDTSNTINPAASELCNDVDDDCDSIIDDNASDAPVWSADDDGDGFGSSSDILASCTQPYGYIINSNDCDDSNLSVNPDATEVCDTLDNDCDGAVDTADSSLDITSAHAWYADGDGDSYGDAANSTVACEQPAGYTSDSSDCDDENISINPTASETCNSTDDNCDGRIDEEATDRSTWYRDADADNYGSATAIREACDQPTGYVANSTDCNDGQSAINPGATETCNSIDDDCDSSIDESGSLGESAWYADTDGDAFGNAASVVSSCTQPIGTVFDSTDCNDALASVNPAASEICNSIDDDCDSSIDEDAIDTSTWYSDSDGDGYGSVTSVQSCTQPLGTVDNSSDCNDTSAAINPLATEACDEIDNDCDGLTDDADSSVIGQSTWYTDSDLDGYGDPDNTISSCDIPAGYISDNADCDDADGDVNPAVTSETYANGKDDNCDDDAYPSSATLPSSGLGIATAKIVGSNAGDNLGSSVLIPQAAFDDRYSIIIGNEGYNGAGGVFLADGSLAGENLEAGSNGEFIWGEVTGDDFSTSLGANVDYLVVGAPASDPAGTSSGSAYVVHAENLVTGAIVTSSNPTILLGGSAAEAFGRSGSLLDFTFFVGAHNSDTGGLNSGSAFAFDLSLLGSGSYAATTYATNEIYGENASDSAGRAVNVADVTGDGTPDYIVGATGQDCGATNSGAVYVVDGSVMTDVDLAAADLKFCGNEANSNFGNTLATGDYDADGSLDIAVGAYNADNGSIVNAGKVFILPYNQWTWGSSLIGLSDLNPIIVAGDTTSDQLGGDNSHALSMGDMDGDFKPEVAMSENRFSANESIVVLPGGYAPGTYQSSDIAKVTGTSSSNYFGYGVSNSGDADGDGLNDLLIGAPLSDNGHSDSGAAYLILGTEGGF